MAARLAAVALVPRVTADPPLGWATTQIGAPTIAESAGAQITEWDAVRSQDDMVVLVTGCVATPIPGWVEDMRPAIDARTTALAGASASKITGVPMDMRPDPREGGGGMFALRAARDPAGPVIGNARTFLGFDESRVFTCFATCATRSAAPGKDGACAEAVARARLEGSLHPPPPGIALRGATWAVHHSRAAALGAGALVLLLAVIAIAARRRPRMAG